MKVSPHSESTIAQYAIYTFTPPGYIHSQAFQEVSELIYYALRALGVDVIFADHLGHLDRRYILFGSNLIPHMAPQVLPESAILFNLEQLKDNEIWLNPQFIALFKRHTVWDYSLANIQTLQEWGATRVVHVPIGYREELTRIQPVEEDIDVLFYGSFNDRRNHILDALRERGVNVKTLFGVYGSERDAWIARSKIVLNLHFYAAKIFEVVRVSYLLANQRFVVSESGESNEDETHFQDGLALCAYDDLVDTCLYYLSHDAERRSVAQQGFNLIRMRDQADALRFLVSEE